VIKKQKEKNQHALLRMALKSRIADLESKICQSAGNSKRLSEAVREVSRVNAELADGIRSLTENGCSKPTDSK